MKAQAHPTRVRQFRMFPELALVLGLPLLSVFIGSTLAIAAYTRGFTALPEPAALTAHRH